MNRAVTPMDMDAAETLSALLSRAPIVLPPLSSAPPQPTATPLSLNFILARHRAHTVSHQGELLQHASAANPFSASADAHHSAHSAPQRYSAPAALTPVSGVSSSLQFLPLSDQPFAQFQSRTSSRDSALSSPGLAAARDGRAARFTGTNDRLHHDESDGHNHNHNHNHNHAQAHSQSAAVTRRLVESPSGKPCPNCQTLTSTLWRSCALLSGQHYLCNACGLRFKKGKYCPLCTRVYYDADTHAGQFKQCFTCANWTHKSCLIRVGELNSQEAEEKPFERTKPYQCTRCRGDGEKMQIAQ